MRIKLNLISKKGLSEIPANYNYFLSAAIYKLLRFGSPEFSSFLHDRGFVLNGKPYKLFTFALRFKKIQMEFDKIKLISPEAELYISSPLIENFIQNFVIGTFQVQSLEISNGSIKSSFDIISVESIPLPVFRRINYFRLLSPIVLSSKKEENGKLTQQYFRYYHDLSEINRVLNINLKNKYMLLHNKEYEGADVVLDWDKKYIDAVTEAGKRLTRKISIIKPDQQVIDIIANLLPFTLSGPGDLIEVGYESGFGEKNSMGFGMVHFIPDKSS